MKKLLLMTLAVMLFASTAIATDPIPTMKQFKTAVRHQSAIYSTSLLADSALKTACKRAIRYVSEDIGGVEMGYLFPTVSDTRFYALPDSIVEVLYVTLWDGDATKSIKAWYPQYAEEVFRITRLDGEGKEQTPNGFNIWNDTLELIPAPAKADSIYLKCFIRHPIDMADTMGSGADSVGLDTMSINFPSAYTEAAIFYASHLVQFHLDNYDKAQVFLTLYDKKRQEIKATYTRKFDLYGGGQVAGP